MQTGQQNNYRSERVISGEYKTMAYRDNGHQPGLGIIIPEGSLGYKLLM